jgi:hypothetical protein
VEHGQSKFLAGGSFVLLLGLVAGMITDNFQTRTDSSGSLNHSKNMISSGI